MLLTLAVMTIFPSASHSLDIVINRGTGWLKCFGRGGFGPSDIMSALVIFCGFLVAIFKNMPFFLFLHTGIEQIELRL